jgi:hypothetical protein
MRDALAARRALVTPKTPRDGGLMKVFQWLTKELREVIPVTLFFFIGFALC